MHTIGVIRVLTTSDSQILEAHGRLIERAFSGVRAVSRCLPSLPQGVFDAETVGIAEAGIVATGQVLVAKGAEALIVSCMMDPGVDLLRKYVTVPVIGAGSAGAALALACGGKVGLLGISDEAPRPVARVLRDALVAVARPAGAQTTVDLLNGDDHSAVYSAAAQLLDQGADAILLGCTGLSTIGMAPVLQAKYKVPVIDPVLASGLVAWHAARNMSGPALTSFAARASE